MAFKENRSSFLEREIRMVLVGKTGVGKSATGNTICGAGKMIQMFKSFSRRVSVTTKCKQHSFKRFGYDLQVVDVPGFCGTNKSDEDIKTEIVRMSSPGIHGILFIVRIGRFTEEDKNALEKFLRCFGKEAKRFVIVVFTGKDDLDEESDTIDNFIGDCPVALKQFLFETSLRFISVNNRGSDEEKDKFTKDLISKVKNMVDNNGGQCYTDEMYEKCEADLREVEMNEKLEGKRQEEFEEKRKQEAAAFEKQIQEAEENMRRQLEEMKDLKRKQTENYERKIEELRREEARKQIREKVGNDDTNYLGRVWQSRMSWFQ